MDSFTASYTPSGGDGQFAAMPEGPQVIVCVDGIDLGLKVEQFENNPPKLVQKYALVFQSAEINEETGKPYEVSREFTVSMHERAALRKFLAAWRGRAYTDEEARDVPLHKVHGHCGIGTIEHKVSAKGRTYAVLSNIGPLLKGMPKVEPNNYERGAYWQSRRDEYAAGVTTFRQRSAPKPTPVLVAHGSAAPGAGMPAVLTDDEDDLPFDGPAHATARPAAPGRVGGTVGHGALTVADLTADIDDIARAVGYRAPVSAPVLPDPITATRDEVADALALNDTRRSRRVSTPYAEGR